MIEATRSKTPSRTTPQPSPTLDASRPLGGHYAESDSREGDRLTSAMEGGGDSGQMPGARPRASTMHRSPSSGKPSSSPISKMRHKLSKMTRGRSGSLQGLPGVASCATPEPTPLALDAGYDDEELDHRRGGSLTRSVRQAGGDAVDDDESIDSVDSGADESVGPEGAGSSAGRSKRGKMARGLSGVARRFKNKSLEGSETMTLGRAFLGSGSYARDNGYVASRSSVLSPEESRRLPVEWAPPRIPPAQTPNRILSATPPPDTVMAKPCRPCMVRGVTDPSASSHQRNGSDGQRLPLDKGGSDGGIGAAKPEARVERGRGSAGGGGRRETGDGEWQERSRDMSVSPSKKGTTWREKERERSRSASPRRGGRVASQSPRLSAADKGGSGTRGTLSRTDSVSAGSVTGVGRVVGGLQRGPSRNLYWDTSDVGLMKDTPRVQPTPRRGSWNDGQAVPGNANCGVDPAPPSNLKYGDRLRLLARLPDPGMGNGGFQEGFSGAGSGGYVGSLDKVQRVHKRLFRRSEMAVIGRLSGSDEGFIDCHFKAVDPNNEHEEGGIVRLGDTVLLVDDRGYVWNHNTHGLAGSVRMKPRGSKKQIAVTFNLPSRANPPQPDSKGRQPAVVFGKEGLEIEPVLGDGRDSRRRRLTSGGVKKLEPLTAYSKKYSSGSSSVSGAFLCANGRGQPVVFEVHVPSASPIGDPSPVITKVIIHAEERSGGSQSPLSLVLERSASEAPTAPLSCVTVEGGGGSGPDTKRPQSEGRASSAQRTCGSPPMKPERHSYQGARGGVGGGGGGGGEGGVSKPSPALSVVTESLTPWENSPKMRRYDEDFDDEDDLSEEDVGGFGGLKWGDHVNLRLPAEDEVLPDDLMLTLRLSNGLSASLTSRQLRANAGRDKFPVAVHKMKSCESTATSPTRDPEAALPAGNGLVYLRCNLTPIVASEADEATASSSSSARMKAPVAAETPGHVALGLLSTILGAVRAMGEGNLPGMSGVEDVTKPSKAGWIKGGVVAWLWMSLTFCLASSAVLLSAPNAAINFSWPTGMQEVPSPSPCTSVWNLRKLDGTPYPHQQLAAAAAAFEEASAGAADAAALDEQTKHGKETPPLKSKGDDEKRPNGNLLPGDAASDAGIDSTAAVAALAASSTRGVFGDVRRALVGDWGKDEETDGARAWTVVCALWLAALASGAVALKALFGSRPSRGGASPSSAMRAQVHLLGWDDRRMSEAAAGVGSTEDIIYQPPSGSDLAPMPHRFVLAEGGDMAKAWARWENTLVWRKEQNVDSILSKPHPRFALIKSKYKHCFHLSDHGGRVTYYERPGLSNFADMKKAGISKQDLLDHYVFCMEYLWQVLQPKQTQRITIIIDLAGVKVMDLVGESVTFLKTTVSVMSRHYPQRSFKIMVLNAPSFFNTLFAAVKPLLNEATKKKIDLLPVANAGVEMLKAIPAESLPVHYGGTSEIPLMKSPAEEAMLAHVQRVLEENGQTMEQVPEER